MLLEGVRAGLGFDTGSLILILVGFLPTGFLTLAEGAWVEVALLLSAYLAEVPSFELPDVAPVESVSGLEFPMFRRWLVNWSRRNWSFLCSFKARNV
jgi:hypothetical protein